MPACYMFDVCCLDIPRYEFLHAGVPVQLRPKVFQVLAYLVEHHDRVVSQQELLEQLWTGEFVENVGLKSYIMEIRKVLNDRVPPHRFIRTVRGRGYQFVASVEKRATVRPAETMPVVSPPGGEVPAPASSPSPPVAAPDTVAHPAGPVAPAVNAEYKPASVLCATLADTPTLAAVLGVEELYRVTQTVLALAQEVMQHYTGTLTPHASGESFTAIFGVPTAQEDHARRAVLAALELHERLRQHPTLQACTGGKRLALSMGIHSGIVVSRLGGNPQRLVTAIGLPTQVAIQLQRQAAPGTTLVSAMTARLVQEEMRVEPWASLCMEGQSVPLSVYIVHGLVRRHAGVLRRPGWSGLPFVGRQQELALLHERLAAARAGAGQVVSLVAPAGMGKTRLLREFRRSLAGQSVLCYSGECLAYGQTTPYLPVRDIVRQVCALTAGDLAEACHAALRRRLDAMGSSTEADVALLLQLLDLPVGPKTLADISPEARHARTFALLRQLVLDEAQRQPLILAVENLQWADPTSETWLVSLAERLAGAAVLLLVTHRPGYQPPWGAHFPVTQLILLPLRAQESHAVVQAVPGAATLPTALHKQIVARGAGNPFFVAELAWHVVEYGFCTTPVPETVHAVLAARLDQLPAAAKYLLQIAAVVGMETTVLLLHAVTAWTATEVHTGLQALQAAEFLYETREVPTPTYAFKNDLTHAVVYGSLLQEQRCALHAQIVERLEALAGDLRSEQVERLAYHALRDHSAPKGSGFLAALNRSPGDSHTRYCRHADIARLCGLSSVLMLWGLI